MDSREHAENIQAFIDGLDDNQVKSFATNGLASLDDETAQKYYHAIGFTPPISQTNQPQREQIAGMPVYDTGIPKIGKVADWTVPVAKWLNENAVKPVQELGEEAGSGM